MAIDGTLRKMDPVDLASAFHCTGRARSGCLHPAKVIVDGLPYCLRCGRAESRKIAVINSERAEFEARMARLAG